MVRERRPSRAQALAAIRVFVCDALDLKPAQFHNIESLSLFPDGADGWGFTLCPSDTTSYVHSDLSIEWYGTSYGELDEDSVDEEMYA